MGRTQVGEGRFVRGAASLGRVSDFCIAPSLFFFFENTDFYLTDETSSGPTLASRTGVGRDVWPPGGGQTSGGGDSSLQNGNPYAFSEG